MTDPAGVILNLMLGGGEPPPGPPWVHTVRPHDPDDDPDLWDVQEYDGEWYGPPTYTIERHP